MLVNRVHENADIIEVQNVFWLSECTNTEGLIIEIFNFYTFVSRKFATIWKIVKGWTFFPLRITKQKCAADILEKGKNEADFIGG